MRRFVAPGMIIAAFVLSAVTYFGLPQSVVVHWSLNGTPNGHASPLFTALFAPLLMLALWTGLGDRGLGRDVRSLFTRKPSPADRSAARSNYGGVVEVMLGNALAFHIVLIASAIGILAPTDQPMILALGLSLGLIILGNYIPRVTKRNLLIGVRSPWAFASEAVWQRTQRVGGYAMVAAGAVGFVGALLVRSAPLKPVFIALILQVSFVYIYSFRLARLKKLA
ncbi:MAG: SdpI family protein [Gemmatimonadota bacterium]|nr:SdpI family protein [Gemmatimonadota bacterium]